MVPLRLSQAVICVLSFWITQCATLCDDGQDEINGNCCDQCRPGEHMEDFCSEQKQTVCRPCAEGYFSNNYNMFDRCEECRSCQHDYAEKCTPTTNAKCSCRSGFLCSKKDCSTCEENKCVVGEKLNITEIDAGSGLIKYSYQCVPECPDDAYFDVKEKICKPRAQCRLPELFPGNKTHNSVCGVHGRISSGGDHIYVIFGIGFVLLCLSLFVYLFSACLKSLKKQESNNNPVRVVSSNTTDFHLSKEESGVQLLIQDECKDCNSFGELAKVTTI